MADQEQKQDVRLVTANGDTVAQDCSGSSSGGDSETVGSAGESSEPPEVIELPLPVLLLAAGIISSGGVWALHDFIHLCFKHPDTANILIPLLAYPVIQWGVKHATNYSIRKRKVAPKEP